MDASCIDVCFKTPANFYICGPSQRGKSHLIRSTLLNLSNLFTTVPKRILYLAGEKQKEFEQLTERIPNIGVIIRFPDNIYDMLEGYDNYDYFRRSYDRMLQPSTCIKFIYSWFPASEYFYFLRYSEFISAGTLSVRAGFLQC